MKPLAITLGDPAGIGPEVVFRALETIEAEAVIFGSRALTPFTSKHRFVDVGGPASLQYGIIDEAYGRVALASLDAALEAIARGECSALVTAPIHKQAIALAGSPHPGHTEFLAARAGLRRYAYDYAMYFDSPSLRTVLHSVHVPLREAIAMVDAESIAALAALTTREYARIHRKRPRIAVAGVNPHAGEGGRFGDEEQIIAHGVERARAEGLEVTGPHPADTLFLAASRGECDVVMAMYHDQGLIPIKTMAFERSVNVTLGLPYLRVSVDHGTAFDIAGKGLADPAPMRYAIQWAAAHAEGYSQ